MSKNVRKISEGEFPFRRFDLPPIPEEVNDDFTMIFKQNDKIDDKHVRGILIEFNSEIIRDNKGDFVKFLDGNNDKEVLHSVARSLARTVARFSNKIYNTK